MCDEAKMREGVRVDKEELQNAYRLRGNCYRFQDRFVKLILPERINLKQLAPIDYGEEGQEFPPHGVYTYLFSSQGLFICIPVKNKFEIGTVHYALASTLNAERVIAAGEMRIDRDGSIVFNLLSGSYMRSFMTRTLRGACDGQLRERTSQMLQTQFPGHDIRYTNETLITDESVPLTADELNRYVGMGIEVRLYRTEKECNSDKELAIAETRLEIEENMNKNSRYPPTQEQLEASQAEIDKLRQDVERLKNVPFEVYGRRGGRRKRTHRRKVQKRRKTRKV